MKERDKNIESLEAVLAKYRLADPVPEGIQKRMMDSKRDIFIRVLKRVGKYTVIIALLQWLYFLLKKFGVGVFASKTVVSVITAAALGGGSYAVMDHITKHRDAAIPSADVTSVSTTNDTEKKVPLPEAVRPAPARYTMGISSFTGESVDGKVLNEATDMMRGALDRSAGKSYARVFKSGVSGVRYSLFGSVESINQRYVVTVKVVDLHTSSIVFVGSEKADSPEGLKKSCVVLAGKITAAVR